jgi:VIT1/CCC1 family predicted Fe2+/Mn2+ transporter
MTRSVAVPLFHELARAQRNEITEHLIYSRLAGAEKDPRNADVLRQIARDELGHYQFWREQTGRDVRPSRWQVFKYLWLARLFGMTFSFKLMERGEGQAQLTYERIARSIPEARRVADDEDRHEQELLGLLDEERLRYVGSMVLGLNDALVELTGALAGLSLAMRNTRVIALAGLITGIAASFSMAASEYLSRKSEQGQHEPLKSSLYTGVAYIVTVMLLIAPYLLLGNYLVCLAVTMGIAILIILGFNYYVSVAKDLPFRRHFLQMAGISLGVAAISFAIGYLIRILLGVEL